jgi:sugar O-acyltransferase (sialic acid O-acetyltransferase NeuD family)
MKVLVVGAGGHGEVIAEILRASARTGGDFEFVGYVDDQLHPDNDAVLGPIRALPRIAHDAVIVAIGDNEARARVTGQLMAIGARFATVTHPASVLATGVYPGDGSMLCAGAIVCVGATIGRGVILNTASSVDHHCRIGDYTHIAPGARIGGEVTIGTRVLVGMGAVVLPRIRIGHDAVIGAGAVVTRDVAPRTTVIGVPAVPIERDDSVDLFMSTTVQ